MWLLPAFGVAFLFFMGALCALLLWKMWKNEIDLGSILNEANGDASISRFQLLIFTLLVAVGIFLFIVNKLVLPDLPPSILTLLGISASTYGVGKAISYSRDEGVTTEAERDKNRAVAVQVSAANAQATANANANAGPVADAAAAGAFVGAVAGQGGGAGGANG